MSNPTQNLRTAHLLAGIVTLIQGCEQVAAASIPVISGHDMQNLNAQLEQAVAAVSPGLFIAVAVPSGKPSADGFGIGPMRWQDVVQIDVTANPMVQSAALAALDVKDILEDYLHGKAPVAGTPEKDRERKLQVTGWQLNRDTTNFLLTYSLTLSVVASNDYPPDEE